MYRFTVSHIAFDVVLLITTGRAFEIITIFII